MEFIFHQICKKNGCNHTFPFKVPLSVFSDQGACLLLFFIIYYYCLLFRFTCFSCGTCTEVHFEQIVNFETLKFL